MKKILHFLFGRIPPIFNSKNRVCHKLSDETWRGWEKRYLAAEYNWKKHEGRSLSSSGKKSS